MGYPTLEEVEAANHEQLARWYRFLSAPGNLDESEVIARIVARFAGCGGMTPEISKKIGW